MTATLVLSAIFIGCGFIVTENNAQYILAGYNTMPERERQDFDLKSFVSYFKYFHIFLGISLGVVSLLLHYFAGPIWSGIFLVTYPFLAYIYLMWKGYLCYQQKTKKRKRQTLIAMGLMVALLAGLIFMFVDTLKGNPISVENQIVNIGGHEGVKIELKDILDIELVDELPKIASKTGGFAWDYLRKGTFETEEAEKVKLLINSQNSPYILIRTKNKKIYYSSKAQSNKAIFARLKKAVQSRKTSVNFRFEPTDNLPNKRMEA